MKPTLGNRLTVIGCLGSVSAFLAMVGTYLAVKNLPLIVYDVENFLGMLIFGWTASIGATRAFSRAVGKQELTNLKGLLAFEFYVLHSVMYLGPLMLTFLLTFLLIPTLTPLIPLWLINTFSWIGSAATGGDETLILLFTILFVVIVTALGARDLAHQRENEQLRAEIAKIKHKPEKHN